MNGALIVFAFVAIAVFGYLLMSSSVATGASGGMTLPENSPSNLQPDDTSPTIPYVAAVVVPPPVLPKLVKYIVLKKNMDNEPDNGLKVLQVAEVKVFTDVGQLDQTAFSDIAYGAGLAPVGYPATNIIDGDLNTFTYTAGSETNGPVPIHHLILTLKNPAKITRIEVYNRTSFMPERLRGTIVALASDLNEDPLWKSEPLSSATTVQVLNPQYSEGFTSIRKLFGM